MMLKQKLHLFANSLWYQSNPIAYLLTPLSCVFEVASRKRKHKQLSNRINFSKPIIVIGNITVGGTGKTPMVSALVMELKALGHRVGVASRGYHGEMKNPTLIAQEHNAQQVGDEPLLISRNTQVPVAVGEDRLAVIELLINQQQCDIVVCDDGLQDYRFEHDVEIVMVDGVRIFGNQKLLPAGPLRESVQRIQQADFIVSTAKVVPAISSDCIKLDISSAIKLNQTQKKKSLRDWSGAVVHAVAGIANPQRFFDALKAFEIEVIEHSLPDHAQFDRTDLVFNDQKPVLITEKDAVKCQQFDLDNIWYVPLETQLPKDFTSRVLSRLNI